jgi:hypothetical protein
MKTRLACILGILALVLSATVSAQTQPVQRGAESSITGTVVSSTSTSLVIRDESGVEQSFDVDTSSTVPAGLMSGSRVSVRFHSMDGGRRHVASVMATDAPATTEPITPPAARVQEPLAASDAAAGERLPDTASEMPLLALAGLMTLAAGLVLRELRRRAA